MKIKHIRFHQLQQSAKKLLNTLKVSQNVFFFWGGAELVATLEQCSLTGVAPWCALKYV